MTIEPQIPTEESAETLRKIPQIEERVEISKTAVAGDIVSVELKTIPYAQHIETTVKSQEARIARHPVGQTVTAIPEVRQTGDTMIIPVVEERLVVRKELVLVEEIHITRVSKSHTMEDTVTLRRQATVITRTPPEPDA